jgi:hypothetical protein
VRQSNVHGPRGHFSSSVRRQSRPVEYRHDSVSVSDGEGALSGEHPSSAETNIRHDDESGAKVSGGFLTTVVGLNVATIAGSRTGPVRS